MRSLNRFDFLALGGMSVNTSMSSEFIGSREFLITTWMTTVMRFFACVSTNVTSLMLESIEGTITDGTFIRTEK